MKAVRAGEGIRKDWGPKLQGWLSSMNSAIAAQQVRISAHIDTHIQTRMLAYAWSPLVNSCMQASCAHA